jgi:quercetin dioxygenase-like cupin family protein
MQRILLFVSLVVLHAFSVAWTSPAGQSGARPEDDAHFTGKTVTMETTGMALTRRRFEAGARTAWHSHPRGQLLLVEEGRARMQKQGQPIKEFGPGESDYTGANVVHWHGAAPTTALVHMAVNLGGETKWLAKVTEEEYLGKPKQNARK